MMVVPVAHDGGSSVGVDTGMPSSCNLINDCLAVMKLCYYFFLAAGTCGRTRHRGKMTQFTTPDPATQDVLDMGMSMTIALSINTIHAFCFISLHQ